MKQVLVLGAGLVSRPLVHYLLARGDIALTVASNVPEETEALLRGHPKGRPLVLDVNDIGRLEELVAASDLVVSLLPYLFHVAVADLCIQHRRNMVTASYVSEAMAARDRAAREAGVLILNELGLDPGIDHMSAMRIIDGVRARGGRIVSFRSYCGGLPAPEANDNPFGYKFSWSPRGVLLAGRNSARYLEDGRLIEVPAESLFRHHWSVEVPGVGVLEGYPNRDSTAYLYNYSLSGLRTMLRGTLRHPGWSETMQALSDLGALSLEPLVGFSGKTWAAWTAHLAGVAAGPQLAARVGERLGLAVDSPVMGRLRWLGLFSRDRLPLADAPPLDMLCELMRGKLSYRAGERDRVILFHEIEAEFPGHVERITSTLVEHGIPYGDTAMSRTVGLPAALGACLILDGRIPLVGVHKPVHPEIYGPILDGLAELGIVMREKTERIDASE